MEKLTTHALDTSSGRPANGLRVRLFHHGELVADRTTNADGRCDEPLAVSPPPGAYRIVFSVGDYYRARDIRSPFLEDVPVDFLVTEGQSYHVPLVFTPWSYSTYRGS